MTQTHALSKNQQVVLDIIEKAKEPLKAYSILFNVQKKGIKAPQQIYRALDKLIEIGKIHKVESRNAFVACKNSNCEIISLVEWGIGVPDNKSLLDENKAVDKIFFPRKDAL